MNFGQLDDAELESINADIRIERLGMHESLLAFAYKTTGGGWRLRKHISSLSESQSDQWEYWKLLGHRAVEVQFEQARRRKARHVENERMASVFNWHKEYAREARRFLSNAQHEEIVDVLDARQDLIDKNREAAE